VDAFQIVEFLNYVRYSRDQLRPWRETSPLFGARADAARLRCFEMRKRTPCIDMGWTPNEIICSRTAAKKIPLSGSPCAQVRKQALTGGLRLNPRARQRGGEEGTATDMWARPPVAVSIRVQRRSPPHNRQTTTTFESQAVGVDPLKPQSMSRFYLSKS
jgi:hypothetical protein